MSNYLIYYYEYLFYIKLNVLHFLPFFSEMLNKQRKNDVRLSSDKHCVMSEIFT